MPKKKEVQWATHDDLRALVGHLATLIAAHDVRLSACEAALPVDWTVKRDADAFVVANNGPGSVVRNLALVESDSLGDPEE